MVLHYKGTAIAPGEIQIVVPPSGGDQPGLPGELGLPPLGEPPAQGTPPANGGTTPPATDLSKPPSFN
jgi:hypothetical protein